MKIQCTIFKPSGKWYADEVVEVPEGIFDHELSGAIKKHARIRNMTYYCVGTLSGVPILVHVGK